ncbi:PIG-L family deacetylase [Saccharopolyspora sp. WRP15-2]|uniref:PIG-L family deacetylase n=1 Tax=Saccharopolyspora oryzae TaxID=2997343 RepID=A0ABT4UZY7_9PSEU|nr:sugar-binding protein [Saccharopolyspora oryzae]MDA3626612.1 PIG-L family deacetylase [Saccharopolyspora oryzae]
MRKSTAIAAAVATFSLGVGPVAAAAPPPPDPVGLDVLFIGAHPDDEASTLSTLGQWSEQHHLKAGVITTTRGEGGGNAVGLEEGPPLGLIREGEERRAVGKAGVEHVYNLDKLDFFYTVSAPLTAQVWDREETLSRVVRIVRATKPKVIVTMNPSPTPGNHGNHQQAARLAVEAYLKAGDPSVFPEQVSQEGLEPWNPGRLFRSGGQGAADTGPDCEAAGYRPAEPTDRVLGVWAGRTSPANDGKTWATVEREAEWEYRTQGWASNPPAPADPAKIACDWFTEIDSRAPYGPDATGATAPLDGAALPGSGGLPVGTELAIDTERFDVVPGAGFEVSVQVGAADRALQQSKVQLTAPTGWQVAGSGDLGTVTPGGNKTAQFTVTPSADAAPNTRFRLEARLDTADGASGISSRVVRVVPEVRGTIEPLPQVGQFRDWAAEVGAPQLDSLIKPVLTVGSGRTRPVRVDLVNRGTAPESGVVRLNLPAGFSADAPEKPYADLAPGATGAVTFEVTNTDPTLPTSNRAPDDGDYPVGIETTSSKGTGTESAALELVPVAVVEKAQTAPVVDGVEEEGEYTGPELDLSSLWEGEPTGRDDISGTAKVNFTDDALHVVVHVTDDVLGTVLAPEDCKRHRRTDSVEITIDPKGTSENTATAFKTGIFPITDDPAAGNPPCFERDADNHQGPGAETAPGMEVASKVSEPYRGYTLEAKIPFDVLPDAVDPARMGLNVLIYDSDTQDRTSQTRVGWSTWNGVRGDPYRWGLAELPGLLPGTTGPKEPVLPDLAAESVDSPLSILQSSADGVPLSGGRGLAADAVQIRSVKRVDAETAEVRLAAEVPGSVRLFGWDGEQVTGRGTSELTAGESVVRLPIGAADRVLLSYESGGAALARTAQVDG